jgi:zinc-ribbon domain
MAFCSKCGEELKDGARFCSGCGTTVAEASTAPVENKPALYSSLSDAPAPKKPQRFMRAVAVAVVLVVVVLMIVYAAGGKTSQPSGSGSESPTLPASEASFIQAVDKARTDADSAENDMQKGGIKAVRDQTICSTLTSLEVPDWVGTVKTVDSNSDGKGVLEIEIAPDIVVKTWNNSLSDISSNTLIQPGTPVFESASAMKPGQLVTFSGTFFPGMSGDCLNESSLTLDGKLKSPEFIFRFATIANYEESQQTSTAQAQPKPAADTPMPATTPTPVTSQTGDTQQPAPIERPTEAAADTTSNNSPGGPMTGDLDDVKASLNGDVHVIFTKGWAADTQNQRFPENVVVFVDGTPSCNATLNDPRPDVADLHGAAYANSGWHCGFGVQTLATGQHTVEAWAVWHVGDMKYKALLGAGKTFTSE